VPKLLDQREEAMLLNEHPVALVQDERPMPIIEPVQDVVETLPVRSRLFVEQTSAKHVGFVSQEALTCVTGSAKVNTFGPVASTEVTAGE